MLNKKTILIAVIVLAVLAAGVFVFIKISNNQNTTNQANNSGNQNSTGNGSVTNTPNVPTTFKPHTDPAQPYTTILPRQDSPTTTTTTAQNSSTDNQTLQQQIAKGYIPDANGQYTQTINENGLSNADQNFYNDATSLSSNQFLQKYVASSNTDPLAVNASTDPQDSIVYSTATNQTSAASGSANPLGVTEDPYIDKKIFTTTQTTLPTDLANYMNGINSDISLLNIIADPTAIGTTIGTLDQAQISAQISYVAKIIQEIKQRPVPEQLLGVAQSYLDVYQSYGNVLADLKQMAASSDVSSALVSRLQNDANALNNAMDRAQTNADAVKVLTQ